MRRANQFIGKGNNHSLPFYGGKRKHDERLVLDQFLIARLGRSWTTYGRPIRSRDYVPIADHTFRSPDEGLRVRLDVPTAVAANRRPKLDTAAREPAIH